MSDSDNNIIDELKAAYKESCDIVRHYSLAVRSIRTITIVQGLTVLSAVVYIVTKSQNYKSAVFGAIFGICIIIILQIFKARRIARSKLKAKSSKSLNRGQNRNKQEMKGGLRIFA